MLWDYDFVALYVSMVMILFNVVGLYLSKMMILLDVVFIVLFLLKRFKLFITILCLVFLVGRLLVILL